MRCTTYLGGISSDEFNKPADFRPPLTRYGGRSGTAVISSLSDPGGCELFFSALSGQAEILCLLCLQYLLSSPISCNNKPGIESTMPSLRINWSRLALGLVLCLAIAFVRAEGAKDEVMDDVTPGASLSLEELNEQLQVCISPAL